MAFKKNTSYEMDMTNGPLLGKLIRYALPVMLSGILQLLFNAVDVIVVGRCVDETALAAVGSTGSLINLIVGLFIGLSIGTNVLVAQSYGAGKKDELDDALHTSVTLGMVCGVFLTVIGAVGARTFLKWMGSPDDVIDQATTYLRIYFFGVPFMMVYNFAAASLRAIGDTKRPMYFLLFAGVVNLFMNLFFVIVVGIGVAGIAIATVASQVVSCVLVIRCLMKADGLLKFSFRKLGIKKNVALRVARIGLPAGVQSVVFSLSNVLIQSSINSFGSMVMAGNTAAANIEGCVYIGMNSMYQTNLSFTSQNMGAGKFDRITKIMRTCLLLVTVIGVITGGGAWLIADKLLGIYTDSQEAISYGVIRMTFLCLPYFTCGLMDTMVGSLRGIGASVIPMIVSLTGACALRVVWIMTVFQAHRTIQTLYISYPISWVVTGLAHFICFLILFRRVKMKAAAGAAV